MVFAMQAAGTRDVRCGPKGLSDDMPCLPVVRRIPVQRLVLDFFQGSLPSSQLSDSRVLHR